MIDAIRAHVEAGFRAATVEPYPFPHLIIEHFFPEDVFRRILEFNPFQRMAGEEWISRANAPSTKSTPYWKRQQINFHREAVMEGPAEQQEFWRDFRDCFLADRWFDALVVGKYKDYFSLRFGALVETPGFYDLFQRQLFLQRHEPGYSIGPHTDVPARVFTCIFSFAAAPGFEEYGTELCAPDDPRVRCWGNAHHDRAGFHVVKVAPYRPNNFLLFFKTRHSFHAVPRIDERVPAQRYGMQYQFIEPGQGALIDLSEPDLVVARMRKDLRARLMRAWGILRR